MESNNVLELFESIFNDEYDGAPDSAYLRGPFVCEGERIPAQVVRLFAARVLERAADLVRFQRDYTVTTSSGGTGTTGTVFVNGVEQTPIVRALDAVRAEAKRVREGK